MRHSLWLLSALGAASALLAGCRAPGAAAVSTADDAPTKQLIATLQPLSGSDRRMYFAKHQDMFTHIPDPTVRQQIVDMLRQN